MPSNSVGTLFVQTRTVPTSNSATGPNHVASQPSPFKPPSAGSRAQLPHTTRHSYRPGTETPEHRTYSVTLASSMSSVQTLPSISTPNRLHGTSTIVLPSTDPQRVFGGAHLFSHPSKTNVSTSLSSSVPALASNATMDSPSTPCTPAIRRLVCPANSLLPSSPPYSSNNAFNSGSRFSVGGTESHDHRPYSVSLASSVSIIQTTPSISTPNRLHGSSTIVLPSTDSQRVFGGVHLFSHPSKTSVTIGNLSTSLSSSVPVVASNATMDLPSTSCTPAIRRLVCPANTLLPSSLSGSFNSGANVLCSPSGNSNVVVFQRAFGRKPTVVATPAIKITAVSSCVPQFGAISQTVATPATPMLSGNHSVRILGLPTGSVCSTPMTPTTAVDSMDNPETDTMSEPPSSQSLEDFIPSLLHRASSLRASIDVDLDADDVAPEETETAGLLATPTPSPLIDPPGSKEAPSAVSTSHTHTGNTVLPVAAGTNSYSTEAADVTAGLKVGQLRAILGLSSQSLSEPSSDDNPPENSAIPCYSKSFSSHQDWPAENEEFSYGASRHKRPRISPSPVPVVSPAFVQQSTDASSSCMVLDRAFDTDSVDNQCWAVL
ncbi:unnamed protein product [Dicrocoelium dendriticum]|nr:unnamed protein product [Dicrocoelium dendriticum]